MFFTKRHLEVVITWADNGGWIVYIGDSRRVYVSLKALVRDLEDYFDNPGDATGVKGDRCECSPLDWTAGGDCDD